MAFTSLGVEISGAVGGSALAGYALDGWLETSPLFVLVLTVLGTAGAFWRMLRILRWLERSGDEEESGD